MTKILSVMLQISVRIRTRSLHKFRNQQKDLIRCFWPNFVSESDCFDRPQVNPNQISPIYKLILSCWLVEPFSYKIDQIWQLSHTCSLSYLTSQIIWSFYVVWHADTGWSSENYGSSLLKWSDIVSTHMDNCNQVGSHVSNSLGDI